MPGKFEGVFNYIQEIWGFISPGIVAAFLGGLALKRAPTLAGKVALLLGPILYACCRAPKWIMEALYNVVELEGGGRQLQRVAIGVDGSESHEAVGGFQQALFDFNNWAFLHHMALIFFVLAIVMAVITVAKPRTGPIEYPRSQLDTTMHPQSYVLGSLVIVATVLLYVIFW